MTYYFNFLLCKILFYGRIVKDLICREFVGNFSGIFKKRDYSLSRFLHFRLETAWRLYERVLTYFFDIYGSDTGTESGDRYRVRRWASVVWRYGGQRNRKYAARTFYTCLYKKNSSPYEKKPDFE